MIKILANDGLEASAVAVLQENGFDVFTDKVPQEQLITFINEQQIKGLLVRSATKVRKDIIDACPDLKLIGRAGVGMDNIDVEYAKSKGVEVINTPASSSQSVAELVFAHLFTIARFLFDANRQMPSKGATAFNELKKVYSQGFELKGKTLGILGFGRIGQAVAQMALGLGMKVLPYDPFVKKTKLELDFLKTGDVFVVDYETVTLDEVLVQSDFITVHVPMPENGGAVIAEAEFAKMKDGVVLINTARGGIIDETALLHHLDTGKVAFAGLDVFMSEPTPSNSILTHPRISLSPHIGGATKEAQGRIGAEMADKVIRYFN